MDETPRAVVHHSAYGTHWMSAAELRAAIVEANPDVDVVVSRTATETAELLPDADIALTSYLEPSTLERATSLRWVQALSAGVDQLPLEQLREREIVLTNAAGVHAQPIAEQVLGYLLAFERRLDTAFERKERGVWERFTGGELAGKTLGIVGLGAIGTRVAEIAAAVGMDVVATKRDPDVDLDAVDRVYGPDGLTDVLLESKYVLLACPLTDETEGLIGREELGVMNDDAVLINVARGPVVDEDALVEALQQRAIRGAALDVFETEPLPADSTLWELSNVIVTPHNAGSSPMLARRTADVFCENYDAFVDGAPGRMRNRLF
ncbi:D-2-hydroxyacid dehydrogenase [Natronobeatus ordinarius]|uniref:D-2-hydroxyacid dehydrogenase n=1 Tax=Natronobeatus ordinarius TaxID=2963433 RepID=UPI0020CD9104|nr:D-2-hydroxyacid dehydrogenase [Natronobeatus ordinarius]